MTRPLIALLLLAGVALADAWPIRPDPEAAEVALPEPDEGHERRLPTLRGKAPTSPPGGPPATSPTEAAVHESPSLDAPGGHAFEGRVVDVEGRPVRDWSCCVKESGRPPRQLRTDVDGRFRLDGFVRTCVWVRSPIPHRWNPLPEFFHYCDWTVPLDRGPVVIRLCRYPRVRLLGRVKGAPADLPCAVESVERLRTYPDGTDRCVESWEAPRLNEGVRLARGRSRLRASFRGTSRVVVVETPELEADEVVEIECPLALPDDHPWLEVRFDRQPVGTDEPVRCAVQVRLTHEPGTWSRLRYGALAPGMLVPVHAADWTLLGAIRIGDEVWFSEPTPVRVHEGDRVEVRLRTRRAGGIRIPALPARWNGGLRLTIAERKGAESGVVVDPPFHLSSEEHHRFETTWWMPPGRYTLTRRPWKHEVPWQVTVEVTPGEVVRLAWCDEGLCVTGSGR